MRTLVDQTFDRFVKWREALDIPPEQLGVHRVMGGADWNDQEWRLHPERDAVFVGTIDMLLSRALNRGFADSKWNWPVSFGAFNSGCQWVFDETQLMDAAVSTGRQLQAFRESFGTAQPTYTMWMSATIDFNRLKTVDAPGVGRVVQTDEEDHQSEYLARRLNAKRSIRSLGDAPLPKDIARHAFNEHRPETMTLVVANTVRRAQDSYKALNRMKPQAELVLIHSRFRQTDRQKAMHQVLAPLGPGGRIVVATQVVEAGLDISCATLITDLAPWSSLVQRAGRCNRAGETAEARMFWVRPKTSHPYHDDELDTSETTIQNLPEVMTPQMLSCKEVTGRSFPVATLRKRDLIELFDTLPDLTGNDIDVGRFIRDSDNRDVLVLWRVVAGGVPSPDTGPSARELCRIPVGEMRRFVRNKKTRAYIVNPLTPRDRRWVPLSAGDIRPNLTILLDAAVGGYTPELGWHGTSKGAVEPVHHTEPANEQQDLGIGDDPNSSNSSIPWLSLGDHLADTELVATEMIEAFGPLDLTYQMVKATRMAARYHDLGKAHPVFQDAIRKTQEDSDPPAPDENATLAKGGSKRALRYSQKFFRHGLVSALMLLGPERFLLEGIAEQDLVVFLAAGHHGRVRLGVRRLEDERPPPDKKDRDIALGVVDGDHIPPVDIPGIRTRGGEVRLSDVGLGNRDGPVPSYTARMLALRDRSDLGPFRLAFMEMLVRMADWRASAYPGRSIS